MAFLDDIGRKITQVGYNAAGKTRDTADLFKLKGEIANYEDKAAAIYADIGKLYYTLHSEDFEPQFAALMTNLKEVINGIEECQKQIQNIKKMTICSNCGAEVPNENRFCTVCGTPRVINSDDIRCTNCGKIVEAGNNFCIYCGTPAPERAVAVAQPETPAAPVNTSVPTAPVAPVVPQAPAVPQAPVAFEAPVVPTFVEPVAYETPVVPQATVIPETPVAFEIPAVPQAPVAFEAPVAPTFVEPVAYEPPVVPVAEPIVPAEPVAPAHENPISHAIDMPPEALN